MDKFVEMQTFVAVVDAGSFIKAADAMNMSKAAVSRYVLEMEARLGVRLLHRTTRRLSLTAEGQIFYSRAKELLADLEDAENEITEQSDNASGLLRINVPFTFGILHLAPLWGDFKAQYPKIKLDITLADRLVDLVDEGYDMAIRIAKLENSTLVSKRLASTRIILCASPAYLKEHGTPLHPKELASHKIISYSYWSPKDEWQFEGPQGLEKVKVNPEIYTNNGDTCRAVALAHHGIILQPSFLVGQDIIDGTLVELMPEFTSIELGIYAVYPTRKHVSAKVRLLIDFLTAQLAKRGAAWK